VGITKGDRILTPGLGSILLYERGKGRNLGGMALAFARVCYQGGQRDRAETMRGWYDIATIISRANAPWPNELISAQVEEAQKDAVRAGVGLRRA